jgi:hypothetical protein
MAVKSVRACHYEPSGETVSFIEGGDCFGLRPRNDMHTVGR